MSNGKTLHEKLDTVTEVVTTLRISDEVLSGDVKVLVTRVDTLVGVVEKIVSSEKENGKELAVLKSEMETVKRKGNVWDGINSLGVIIGTVVSTMLGKN